MLETFLLHTCDYCDFYASAQRSVAGGKLFLSCSSVHGCVRLCVRVCVPEHGILQSI